WWIGVCHRTIRTIDDRALSRIFPEPAHRHGEGRDSGGRSPAAAAGVGTAPTVVRVERDESGVSERGVHPRAVRGPGGEDTRGHRGGCRGWLSQLRGAEPSGEPAGALPPRLGGGAGRAGGDLCGTQLRDDRGAAGSVEGGGSVCAAGSGLSGGTAALHAR